KPLSNKWSPIAPFPKSEYGDGMTSLLPDGKILLGYIRGPETFIYDPAVNKYSGPYFKLRGDPSAEETWLTLPDGSILSYDIFSGGLPAHAQRFIRRRRPGSMPATCRSASAPPPSTVRLGR